MKAINSKHIRFVALVAMVLSLWVVIRAYGYGYGMGGKDTIVAIYEKTMTLARAGKFEKCREALKEIEVPIDNFKKRNKVELKPAFLKAIESKDIYLLDVAFKKLIFTAVVEKCRANLRENLAHPLPSKARLIAIIQYYLTLKPDVLRYDEANGTSYDKECRKLLHSMNETLPTAGFLPEEDLPGKPEDWKRFSWEFERKLLKVSPFFAELNLVGDA